MTARYPAKVLLFGEHTIINGSKALATPLHKFFGQWGWHPDREIDSRLTAFYHYVIEAGLHKPLKTETWYRDIQDGLLFDSNVPFGYGLGSSGTLVAALADRYGELSNWTSYEIRTFLGKLEECFHAKSSGFDPYISYTGQSILAHGMELTDVKLELGSDHFTFCLIDTGRSRSSGLAIKMYQESLSNASFNHIIRNVYLPHVDSAIEYMLSGEHAEMNHHFEQISQFQLERLSFLIDPDSIPIWNEGLSSDYFKIKICGAGQGGFLLCLTSDLDRLKRHYSERNIIPL